MKDLLNTKTGILLRHDLDDEMESALKIAKMEFDMGMQSTFYFLISCQFYNVFSSRGRHIINGVREMGHEIGLHFDPSIYEDVSEGFKQEIRLMEDLIADKVYSVSTHAPSLHGIYPQFEGIIDAYDKSLFSKENYFSDSRLEFHGNIKSIIEKARTGLVQLLFHPISYCLRNENKPPNIISLYKAVIKKFGDDLFDQVSKVPIFNNEIKNYPTSVITINIKIK